MSSEFFDNEDEDAAPAASNVMELSVTEISSKLKRMVEDTFGRVRVRGEIAGYRGPHSSGHMYFALKDEKARIEAVVWRGVAGKLKHRPEEGMEVIATGKLTTYPGSSKYQIVIEQIEPAGAGALMALLEERKKKLEAEGLFAPDRKQLLPYMPLVVGVITSPTGAVIRDILHRIADRFPLHVIVWPVRVQGDTAGKEVAWAINGFNALDEHGGVAKPDVLIVARGGGSVEDLWGFNDEAVVRAAANSMIPIVSAVGHETDWTLIDMAADVRAPTPTGAAEMIVQVKADLEAHLATLGARLRAGLSRTLDSAKTSLKAAMRGLPTPDSLFAVQSQRFDSVASRLSRGLVSALQTKQLEYQQRAGKLTPSLLGAPVERKGQRLEYTKSRLLAASKSQIELKSNALAKARLSPNLIQPSITDAKRSFEYATNRFDAAKTNRGQALRQKLDQASRLLNSFSHEKTLERGFSLVRDLDRKVITRANQTAQNMPYEIEFADDRVSVIRNDSAKAGGAPSIQSPKKTSGKSDEAAPPAKQGSLF